MSGLPFCCCGDRQPIAGHPVAYADAMPALPEETGFARMQGDRGVAVC